MPPGVAPGAVDAVAVPYLPPRIPSYAQAAGMSNNNHHQPFAFPSPPQFATHTQGHRHHNGNHHRDIPVPPLVAEAMRDAMYEEGDEEEGEEDKPTGDEKNVHKKLTNDDKVLLFKIANGRELYKMRGKAGVQEEWKMVAEMMNLEHGLKVNGPQCNRVYNDLIQAAKNHQDALPFRSGQQDPNPTELVNLVEEALQGANEREEEDKKAKQRQQRVREGGRVLMENSYATVAPLVGRRKRDGDNEEEEKNDDGGGGHRQKAQRRSWHEEYKQDFQSVGKSVEDLKKYDDRVMERLAEMRTADVERAQQAAERAADDKKKKTEMLESMKKMQRKQLSVQKQILLQQQEANSLQQQTVNAMQQQTKAWLSLAEKAEQLLDIFVKKS